LFRKYNYPDRALVEAFKDETTKQHLNLISQVAVELTEDGTIKEYGRSVEPKHITRRITDPRPKQEGEDAGTDAKTPSGGVGGSEGNQQNLIISEGRPTSENDPIPDRISESTE
jgi:hypothetical protein